MKTTISAPEGLPFVEMSREFEASRDLVYRAHTDPELLIQWLGPRRMTMTVDRYDVRDGGSWRYVHSDPDGNEYGFHGVFHGEPTLDGIVQTFEFEGAPGHVSLDRLMLEDLGGGRTLVRVHSTFESVTDRDAMVEAGMAQGVDEGYARLDELISSLAPVA